MSIAAAQWDEARSLRLAMRLRGMDTERIPAMGMVREGVLRRAVGLTLEATGCEAPLGSRCSVESSGGRWVDAEVVGFAGDRTFLMPTSDLSGLLPNARVITGSSRGEVAVGEGLLGRVIDSDGVPLDGRPPLRAEDFVGLSGVQINPLMREPITRSLDVGVRAINALLPIGRGRRRRCRRVPPAPAGVRIPTAGSRGWSAVRRPTGRSRAGRGRSGSGSP